MARYHFDIWPFPKKIPSMLTPDSYCDCTLVKYATIQLYFLTSQVDNSFLLALVLVKAIFCLKGQISQLDHHH